MESVSEVRINAPVVVYLGGCPKKLQEEQKSNKKKTGNQSVVCYEASYHCGQLECYPAGEPWGRWRTYAQSYPSWGVRERGVGVLILWHFWTFFHMWAEQAPVTRAKAPAESQARTQGTRKCCMNMDRASAAMASIN